MSGKLLILLAALVLAAGRVGVGNAGGADVSIGFLFKSLKDNGRELKYAVHVPRGYDPSRPWPLILFLHGSGESGTDGSRQLAQGLPRELVWSSDRWPFIVIIPQKPSQDAEWEQYELELMTILAHARREYNVDPTRLVLTGLSQGGHGAWVLAARHPELWAAVVPVCGYGPVRFGELRPSTGTFTELAEGIGGIPVWAFHGEADDVVPVRETRAMIAALEAAGTHPRVTVYPGVGHGCWERAYGEPELSGWLLAQRRPLP
jgi:predicted peptidase